MKTVITNAPATVPSGKYWVAQYATGSFQQDANDSNDVPFGNGDILTEGCLITSLMRPYSAFIEYDKPCSCK